MASKIEVGKQYMLIHGDGEGDDYNRSPSVPYIDLSFPVTVVDTIVSHQDGEKRWYVEYRDTSGIVMDGFASDRSFGEEVK